MILHLLDRDEAYRLGTSCDRLVLRRDAHRHFNGRWFVLTGDSYLGLHLRLIYLHWSRVLHTHLGQRPASNVLQWGAAVPLLRGLQSLRHLEGDE